MTEQECQIVQEKVCQNVEQPPPSDGYGAPQSPVLVESPHWAGFPVGSHETQERTPRRKKLRRGRGRVTRSDIGDRNENDDITERRDEDISVDEDLPEKTHKERSAVYPHTQG